MAMKKEHCKGIKHIEDITWRHKDTNFISKWLEQHYMKE